MDSLFACQVTMETVPTVYTSPSTPLAMLLASPDQLVIRLSSSSKQKIVAYGSSEVGVASPQTGRLIPKTGRLLPKIGSFLPKWWKLGFFQRVLALHFTHKWCQDLPEHHLCLPFVTETRPAMIISASILKMHTVAYSHFLSPLPLQLYTHSRTPLPASVKLLWQFMLKIRLLYEPELMHSTHGTQLTLYITCR